MVRNMFIVKKIPKEKFQELLNRIEEEIDKILSEMRK